MKNDTICEWFYDESFWGEFAPVMFDQKHWDEVPDVAEAVGRMTGLAPGGGTHPAPRLLDMCCGFGRLSLEFARRGWNVTGVDITKSYLEAGRLDAADENLPVEFLEADGRAFHRPDFFDAAVNLYISFGYFDDEADDEKLLRNIFESLKPGGMFVIETLGKEIAVRDFVEAEWFYKSGRRVLTEYQYEDSCTRLRNHWIIQYEGKEYEKTFSQRLYAASELRSLLKRAGFSAVETYGSWKKAPYDQYAEALIAAAIK